MGAPPPDMKTERVIILEGKIVETLQKISE